MYLFFPQIFAKYLLCVVCWRSSTKPTQTWSQTLRSLGSKVKAKSLSFSEGEVHGIWGEFNLFSVERGQGRLSWESGLRSGWVRVINRTRGGRRSRRNSMCRGPVAGRGKGWRQLGRPERRLTGWSEEGRLECGMKWGRTSRSEPDPTKECPWFHHFPDKQVLRIVSSKYSWFQLISSPLSLLPSQSQLPSSLSWIIKIAPWLLSALPLWPYLPPPFDKILHTEARAIILQIRNLISLSYRQILHSLLNLDKFKFYPRLKSEPEIYKSKIWDNSNLINQPKEENVKT